ncbi:MAG: hypothetical protein JRK53_18320 [Deltaproteobacteria bacterium]|nr:hypothetical protein [Deltaproteobacteria bacterium]MBW1819571.1 hypothetical protein [Deltaproteobacteria bacterium]
MKDFTGVSPLRVLEKSSRKALGAGNLGVLIARAGVGKTACLIHIAFDKIFRKEKLVHVSLGEGPEKVISYYNVIYSDLVKALNIEEDTESRLMIDRNRMILAYMNQSFDLERLSANLKNLAGNMDFKPNALIVDGLDFETAQRSLIDGFKDLAVDEGMEIWFSALSHRHIVQVNDRGIPFPCHELDDLFSLIVQLVPEREGIFLKLLKDHDNPSIRETGVMLDPNTFLAMEQ